LARLLPTLLVVFLLAGTAVAFAVTQALKNERSPVLPVRFDRVVGPSGKPAELLLRLRGRDRLTARIVDANGDTVRTLLREELHRAGRVSLAWDGRADDGTVVAEGVYRLRVRRESARQTIEIPIDIRVDATAPAVSSVTAAPPVFSPDGDGRADRVVVRYESSEKGGPLLRANGRLVQRGMPRGRGGAALQWFGEAAGGRRLRPGRYELTVEVVDAAGNVSAPSRARVVRLRYVEITRGVLRARPGRRFRVPLSTDTPTVRWRLAGRTGLAPSARLRIRAPREPGHYRLFVSTRRHADSAVLVVRARS
jgi:hypothetical protein